MFFPSGNVSAAVYKISGIIASLSPLIASGTMSTGGVALTGRTDNTVTTVTGADAIQGEARLLFDGQNLTITDGGTGAEGKLNFGDAADADVGRINYNHATNYMTIFTNGSEQLRITSAGKVGIGDSDPKGIIHAKSATSGQNPHANADEGIFEGSAHSGISILSGNSSYGRVMFGDDGLNDIGAVAYNHSDNSLAFTVNNAEQMKIDSAGIVTKPSQPAFKITQTSALSVADGHSLFSSGTTEVKDVNADWASGTFTAPVDGFYYLSVSVLYSGIGSGDTDTIEDYLKLSNGDEIISRAGKLNDAVVSGGYFYQPYATIAYMDASDTCYCSHTDGGTLVVHPDAKATHFEGYLLG